MGEAKLMGAFTGPGQMSAQLVALRDRQFGVETERIGEARMTSLQNIQAVLPGADQMAAGFAKTPEAKTTPAAATALPPQK